MKSILFKHTLWVAILASVLFVSCRRGVDPQPGGIIAEEATLYEDITLQAPLPNRETQTFFSTNDGVTYSMNRVLLDQPDEGIDLSALVDWGYYYGFGGDGMEATFAAPAEYPIPYGQDDWTTQNQTRMKKTGLTRQEFQELDRADTERIRQIYEEAEFGAQIGVVSNLQEGDVIAFETDPTKPVGASRRGLVLIDSLTAGADSEGKITFDVLMNP